MKFIVLRDNNVICDKLFNQIKILLNLNIKYAILNL
jgi:hypothetical protein